MNKRGILLVVVLLASLTVSASAQDAEWELSQTLEVDKSYVGFTMSYPEGWFVDESLLEIRITELEVDRQQPLGEAFATQGYTISLVFQRNVDLRDTGINIGVSTLEDLLAFNSGIYGFQEPTEMSETTFLSWPALRVRTIDGMGNEVIAIQGFYPKMPIALFLLMVAAPSADALDAFLPSWDTMLESIVINKGEINIGSHSLYLECSGAGSPTVILEPDVPNDYQSWRPTLNGVSEFTRVCTHSRDIPGHELFTFQDYADDTHTLLTIAGVDSPYVLAGWWISGYSVRVYAGSYMDEVVGMVLYASVHPDTYRVLAEQGWYTWEQMLGWWRAWDVEYEPSIAQVSAVDSLGDMPLIVLVPGDAQGVEDEWFKISTEVLQPDLAALSTNSTLTIIEEGSYGHPPAASVMVDAIRQVVEEVRAQGE